MSQQTRCFHIVFCIFICIFISACASRFPSPELDSSPNSDLSAEQIFSKTFLQHGGHALDKLNDVNVSLTGKWKPLIKRIQPLVTDFNYRVDSQERLFPHSGGYVAIYSGPSGSKKVIRSPNSLEVYYNGVESTDQEVLSSTALTADAFHMFLLGPLSFKKWQNDFIRLTDALDKGNSYYRLYLNKQPGFGYSSADEIILWIDKQSLRTFRIQITLQGHSTTQNAHVEVDYLEFIQSGDYLFPSVFFERVKAPIAIDAHAWHLTGLDINRGSSVTDYLGNDINITPAKKLNLEK